MISEQSDWMHQFSVRLAQVCDTVVTKPLRSMLCQTTHAYHTSCFEVTQDLVPVVSKAVSLGERRSTLEE